MGNCCSKCFEEDQESEGHVDPKTPLLGSTIKSIADTGTLSSQSFSSIFSPRTPSSLGSSSEVPPSLGEAVLYHDAPADEAPIIPPKPEKSQRSVPSPPTGRFSAPPRQPSRVNLSRASADFFATPPPPPSQAYTTPPSTPSLPARPSQAALPIETTQNTQRAYSTQPSQPAQPAQIVQPAQATQPEQPAQATHITESAQATQITQPAGPTQSEYLTQPAQSPQPQSAESPNSDSLRSIPRPPSIPPVPQFDIINSLPPLEKSDSISTTNSTPNLPASEQSTNQPTTTLPTTSQSTDDHVTTSQLTTNNQSTTSIQPTTSQTTTNQTTTSHTTTDQTTTSHPTSSQTTTPLTTPDQLTSNDSTEESHTTTNQLVTSQSTTTQPAINQLTASQNDQISDTTEKDTEKDKENKKTKEKEKERQTLTASQLIKILTNKTDDVTPQERISQIIQASLGVLKEIGDIVTTSDLANDLSAETTMKKRLDVLTLKASKNTVQLCEVVETLTSLRKSDTKRGKWEEELREITRKASSKIEQLVIECRNANIEQRKANARTYIEKIGKLLERIRSQVTQLVELVLAQGEVMQSAQSIIDTSNKHSSVAGVENVLRSAKVAVSVVQRLVDSLTNELVIGGTSDLKKSITKTFMHASMDPKEMDPAAFVSNAVHVCAIQLFDAIDAIAQGHFDPGVQLELWNKAKVVRGAGFLLQLSIMEKNRELSDRCLSLSAASRVFSSSVVDLIESSVSAVTMSLPKYRQEDGAPTKGAEEESENVWTDEEKIAEIILFDPTENPSLSSPLSPSLSSPLSLSSLTPSSPRSSPSPLRLPARSPLAASSPPRTEKEKENTEKEEKEEKEKEENNEKEEKEEKEKEEKNEKEEKSDNKENSENEEKKEREEGSEKEENGKTENEEENKEKEDNRKEEETQEKEEKGSKNKQEGTKEGNQEKSRKEEANGEIAETEPKEESKEIAKELHEPQKEEKEEKENEQELNEEQKEERGDQKEEQQQKEEQKEREEHKEREEQKEEQVHISTTPVQHTEPLGVGRKLKAATLNGLLLYLIFDRIDIQYNETIALTYRSFVDSKPFFLKLVELYNVPESKEDHVVVIQSRVATFLKKWISLQVQDFSDDLIKTISKWTEERMQPDTHMKGVAKQILEILALKNDERNAVRKSFADEMQDKLHKELTPINFVLDMEPHEIALQLTLIDHALFCAIRPHELLFQSWNKPHLRHRAPNVLSMISRTNNIALWVASSILWHPKLSDRAHVMTKLIVVAEHLRKLKNFNTMFAVLSGLQLSSVNRLKYTKEKVPKKQNQTFDSLVELMSATKSFKAYREALAAEIPPCIPYLGLCLTDLTFIEEGNPDYIAQIGEGPKKLINFKKREKLCKVISDIQQYQNWKYQEKQGEKNSILEELPRNEEEQLYGMSLLREPRNATREQIV